MEKITLKYPWYVSKYSIIILTFARFLTTLLFIYLTITTYPNIRFIIFLIIALYFLYIFLKTYSSLRKKYPYNIILECNRMRMDFVFGKSRVLPLSDIESITRSKYDEPYFITLRIINNKDVIGMDKQISNQYDLLRLIKEVNPNCNIIDELKN